MTTIRYRKGLGPNRGVWELVNEWGVTKAFFHTKAEAREYLMELGGIPIVKIDISELNEPWSIKRFPESIKQLNEN